MKWLRKRSSFASVLLFNSFVLPAQPVLPTDAHGLADYIMYRNGSRSAERAVGSCGQSVADHDSGRRAALLLAGLGSTAIPALEAELDSIESDSGRFAKPDSRWIFLAYAQLRGVEALPRLRRMLGDRRYEFLQRSIDFAIAVAQRITGFVDSARVPVSLPDLCGNGTDPRDALDQLILGLVRDDRTALEAALALSGRRSLGLLVREKGWDQWRASLWGGVSGY